MVDFDFLKQADTVTLNLEKAKRAIEIAKQELEQAKIAYDETFSQAEEHGIPKAKLRKLTEDRVQAMIESGLLDMGGEKSPQQIVKAEKVKKTKKKSSQEEVAFDDEHIDDRMDDEVNATIN
ncbi:MAG TPA: hypothetical protein PLU50_06605 [Pseudobdellovibrionaceae bacterium]|nr:hypothetical protein [Pseudobdellovibrionaceae bacterium]